MRQCTRAFLALGIAAVIPALSQAAVVMSYDAAAAGAGVTPSDVGWTRYGTPMTNNGSFLLQNNTADDPDTSSGEYLSPPTANLMHLASGQYGVEVKVRPLNDVPFLGSSHYANAYVTWSDDSYNYNITIDKDSDDSGTGTTGGVKYGKDSLSDAVTGIDWSVPHTIFLGYTGVAPYGSFDVYVDGVHSGVVSAGSIARGGSFAQNAVDFGDGTTGQGIDVGVEWYRVALHDTASPPPVPEPMSLSAIALGALLMIRRTRD